MKLIDVPADELPDNSTHGFRLDTGDPLTGMFFHWHERGLIEIESFIPDGEGSSKMGTVEHPRTSYDDVINAIPARLKAFGLEDSTDDLLKQVRERYGS